MGRRGAESARLAKADAGDRAWRAWGPYLSERAWGTVREDYSAHGTAWDYFPHDHARSRAYRWSEDGLAGVSDENQTFCFALALWNGKDAIIKERIFGLSGPEGNHGEDAKEYWWYTDSTPTHSWMSWRYHYPQARFPYGDIVRTNAARGREEAEYELADTGIFDGDRYWAITVDYAKAGPTDLCIRVSVTNQGPERARLHLLPTLWFRNTWAWGTPGADGADGVYGAHGADGAYGAKDANGANDDGYVPQIRGERGLLVGHHRDLGTLVLAGQDKPEPLCCDNESNAQRLWELPNRSPYPKDAINDYLVIGEPTLNPERVGTKAALHYLVDVAPGATKEIRLRLAQRSGPNASPGRLNLSAGFARVMATRKREADEFFDQVSPPTATADERLVLRQAVAGLMWSKQFYHYDVARWLAGDPAADPPPLSRGRNQNWRHLRARDVISMPDPWEYPWFAAWDLAFQAVAIARVDPGFAKEQVLLLLRETYQHPNGQIPAYEWAFDDVNPPVHGWAALRVFELDGGRDYNFLARALHKLLMNFTWWVNRKDPEGDNVYAGGFLGLDNVGPFDRGAPLPVPGKLEQSDATAWMAMYALNLLHMALLLGERQPAYVDLAGTLLDHFEAITSAAFDQGLWDDEDAFFYDVVRLRDGTRVPLQVRSVVGLLPLAATTTLPLAALARLSPAASPRVLCGEQWLLSAVGLDQLTRILARMLDPEEFLSSYGLRTLSRAHRDSPFTVSLGGSDFRVGYEPGESVTDLFGGNSNWRGPVWFPVNQLIIEGLRHYAAFFGDHLMVEYPTGSGAKHTLGDIADDLTRRLIGLFVRDAQDRRPVHGDRDLFQTPAWRDLIPFYEYFHGDTGAGLGASHQTGWTALVVDLIMTLRRS